MSHALRTLALPTALAAALFLSACGSADTSGTTGTKSNASASNGASVSKTKNAADVEFATMMIPHHTQAVALAELALKQGTSPKVKALASKIEATQGPENQHMSGWLSSWGEPAAPAGSGSSGGSGGSDMAGMGGMGGPTGGMMSAQEMTSLGKASGTSFDRMWLASMVKHHQGAVDMCETALDQGANPDAKKLATSIISSQTAEIAQMQSLLAELPS